MIEFIEPETPPEADALNSLLASGEVTWEETSGADTSSPAPSTSPEKTAPEHDFIAEVKDFFSPGGGLSQFALSGKCSYEFRPQQLEMALAVAESLKNGRNLCVEAPTGVGKSFAYLLVLIYLAAKSRIRSVISTETINLQEQLIEKDIPFLKQATGLKFKAALAKGRSNYLCLRRLSMLSDDEYDKLLPDELLKFELAKLERSVKDDDCSGERDAMEFHLEDSLWSLVCCESLNCMGPKCPFFRRCFYQKAKRSWEEADIIVANHALFFTDMRMKMENQGMDDCGLLPRFDAVVIDEAHTLENNAAEHLGLHISHAGMRSTVNKLYNPSSARGLLMKEGVDYLALRNRAKSLLGEIESFFAGAKALFPELQSDAAAEDYLRVRQPDILPDMLSKELFEMYENLRDTAEGEENESLKTELNSYAAKFLEYAHGLSQFLHMELDDAVYYLENGKYGTVMNAAPLNVAELLGEILFRKTFPVILCSATLSIRRSFDYFVRRTGFCDGEAFGLDSPFKSTQATIYLHRDMPDPNSPDYPEKLIEYIPVYLEKTGGKAFVLFTSYRLMHQCADRLAGFFEESGLTLLMQGEGLSRSMMLKKFKTSPGQVIFGADSFWTGVDVPGEALSNVIITRLPFQMPGHPLIEGRCERIAASGGKPFFDYTLPEAVLKFRQGIGRLIRSTGDSGIIAVLDGRILQKSYGRTFFESLPYKVEIV